MFSLLYFSSRNTPDSDLPPAIYRALIESLFRGGGANLVGVSAHLLLSLFILWSPPTQPMAIAAALLTVACTLRMAVDFTYPRGNAKESALKLGTCADIALAEWRYLSVSSFFSIALGLLVWFAMTEAVDANIRLLVVVASTTFVVSGCGRCCGSPRVVLVQTLLVVLPFTAAMIWSGGKGCYFAALMSLFVIRNLRDVTRTLHGTLVSMLTAHRGAADAATKFDTALNNMGRGLVMIDNDGLVRVANRWFTSMFSMQPDPIGKKIEAVIAEAIAPLVDGPDAEMELSDFFSGKRGSTDDVRLNDGRMVTFSYEPMPDGSVVTVVDVTARRAAEESIRRMARYDAVTGLTNRAYFTETLSATIRECGPDDAFGLMSVDLDRFKEVNDSYGHHVGDQILRLVAERMRSVVAGKGFVARLGGDEFMVLLDSADRAQVGKIGAAVVRALSQPYEIESELVRIGASAGVAIFPQDAETPHVEALMKAADMALYDAKASGRGVVKFFVEDMAHAVRRRRQIGDALRDALVKEELSVAYQPIIDLETNNATTIEALVRWNSPMMGSVSPADFIPIAEETGSIVEIGAFVLKRACIDALAWPGHIRVAVNLSAIQFDRGDLIETVTTVLRESGLPPERLELEITESILIGNLATVLSKLNALHKLGIHVALDDFGAGYSSLSYLNDFEFDKVKVDQSFVRDIDATKVSKGSSIIKAVNAIGKDLHMAIVVEGVETRAQLAALRKLGVHCAQGYLFSRPTSASEIGLLLLKEAGASRHWNEAAPVEKLVRRDEKVA